MQAPTRYRALLPTSVSATVDAYFELLRAERIEFVRGFYLLGSVALADYQEGRSDIDFGAIIEGAPDHARVDRLARVHEAMGERTGPSFDGFYLEAHRLQCTPAAGELATFSLDGVFYRHAPCFECNPATWLLWAKRGITLLGPPSNELQISVDENALRRFEIENLEGYWRHWIKSASSQLARKSEDEPMDADTIAWGVLGVARIACMLTTGRVVSKTDAGIWAMERAGHEDGVVLGLALAARRGGIREISVKRGMHALDCMETMISNAVATPR